MWTVSPETIAALSQSQEVKYTATLLVNNEIYELVLGANPGNIQLTRNTVRRRWSGTLIPSEDMTLWELCDLLAVEDAVLTLKWVTPLSEEIPFFTGRPFQPGVDEGSRVVTVSAADFGADLNDQDITTPKVFPSTTTRKEAIISVVSEAMPGVLIRDSATDNVQIGTELVVTGRRAYVVTQLANDGGMDCFFAPDGAFIIRDAVTKPGTPVQLIRTGNGGSITGIARQIPADRKINTVVVEAETTDGTQNWEQVTAEVTDTGSPRHKSRIGVRALQVKSATTSQAEASSMAKRLLNQQLGKPETINLTMVANPALEVDDTLQIIVSAWQEQSDNVFNHLVESARFDMARFSMNIQTRNMGASNG